VFLGGLYAAKQVNETTYTDDACCPSYVSVQSARLARNLTNNYTVKVKGEVVPMFN
jgi:hypothetical protein